jgi:3-hydroxyisobutyrate dehydrogenase
MTTYADTGPARRVAVLGTGTMGAPIARNLLHAGLEVRVWNRSAAKAQSLAADGAVVAAEPAAAADGADTLITMLTDGNAVQQVMTGPGGALSRLGPNAVWIQMSTVGVAWTDRLAELAARSAVAFVDAPVSGSSQPAQDGQLVILASGAGPVRSRVTPVFDVLGRQTLWLERAGEGSRLKLALNNWLAVLVEGMAETLILSDALGLDPHLVLATIAGGPLASPYATNKGNAMLEADFAPGFPLQHATKDAALAADAAHDHHVDLALTDALLRRWEHGIELGHGAEDVAAAINSDRKG